MKHGTLGHRESDKLGLSERVGVLGREAPTSKRQRRWWEYVTYLSTRENVKGIHVPLLCQGNQASHEFVNMEITYEMSASADKEYLALAGSCHDYTPVTPEYGDVLGAVCDYFEQWLCKPGRFE